MIQHISEGALPQNGKYRIICVLGQGGYDITYLALHTMLDKQVTIKEFFPKEYCDREESTSHVTIGTKSSVEIVEILKGKFIKESKNISKLNHPNIITIYDIFQENNTAYYVMEYVEGQSLSELVKQNGHMTEKKALGYIRKMSEAIGYMHSLNMNHLDIKPANIMIRSTNGEPVLIDFGLSKQYDASGGQTSTTPVGISHGYAPAEQYRPGGVSTFSPQTDIYALGATLFYMLSGNVPPHYSEIIEDGVPELPSQVSRQTYEAIEKAMEIKKTKRPASIQDFLNLLPEGETVNSSIFSDQMPIKENVHAEMNLPESSTEKSDKSSIKSEEKPATPYVEETVILNVPLSDISFSKPKTPEKEIQSTDNSHSDIQYIDLGLSVKWAMKLSGIANPVMSKDTYKFQLNSGETITPNEFISTHQLPTINQFEELIERCKWTTFTENGLHGYKIVGPNGNIIIMPLGVLNHYLTAECLKPERLYYYFLYLGEFTHSLAKGVPVRANIWTVKE